MKASQAKEGRKVTCVKAFIVGLNQPLRHLKGAETWFQHPPILLLVRPQSVLRRLLLKGPVVQGVFWIINFEPGSSPNNPTIGFSREFIFFQLCLLEDMINFYSDRLGFQCITFPLRKWLWYVAYNGFIFVLEWSLSHNQLSTGLGVHLFEAHKPCLLPYEIHEIWSILEQ